MHDALEVGSTAAMWPTAPGHEVTFTAAQRCLGERLVMPHRRRPHRLTSESDESISGPRLGGVNQASLANVCCCWVLRLAPRLVTNDTMSGLDGTAPRHFEPAGP